MLEASSGQLGGMDTCMHPIGITHAWSNCFASRLYNGQKPAASHQVAVGIMVGL